MKTRILGKGDGPMVLLLHGFGAPGDDLVPLAAELRAPAGTRFAFPEAPIDLGFGRAWWMIDPERFQSAVLRGTVDAIAAERPAGLDEARDMILGVVHALERDHGVDARRLVLGGFSQGAMLSLEAALSLPAPPPALLLMSPTIVDEAGWRARAARLRGVPVLLSHGRQDPLLPFSQSEKLWDLLAQAGAQVTFVPFQGGHTIDGKVLEEASAVLKQVLRPPPPTGA